MNHREDRKVLPTQSVKEPANRQNHYLTVGIFSVSDLQYQKLLWINQNLQKACYARNFDLLHNSPSNVPPVRRRGRVACLGDFFDLCSLSKKLVF